MDIMLTGAVIGVAISAFVTLLIALFGPKIKEKFKLREIYLAPFRKWCSKLYGDLDEFNRRYLRKGTDCRKYPPIQIIDDYRMIHEVLKDAPIWVGKIEKEYKDGLIGKIRGKIYKDYKNIYVHVTTLTDIVDAFWHELEGQNNLKLKDRMDIIQIPKNKRERIAEKICKHIEKTNYPNIQSILDYLRKKQIP